MAEQPPVPPAGREPLPAWVEAAEAESGDLGDRAGDLPALVLSAVSLLVFFAILVAIVLTVVRVAKFPWLAGG